MLASRLYIPDPKEKRASLTTILCHRSCRDQLHHTRPLRHNHDPYPVLLLQQSKCLNWWGALISLKHATIMEDCKWCSEGFLVSFTHFTNLSFPHVSILVNGSLQMLFLYLKMIIVNSKKITALFQWCHFFSKICFFFICTIFFFMKISFLYNFQSGFMRWDSS